MRAPRWVDAFTTGQRARCERDLFAVPARCLPTPRALCFHVLTTPFVSYRCIYMMMLGKLGEVDGGAHLLGGALLSSRTTTCTSGTIADLLLGRACKVARVPIGTRALQEAWEAGRRGSEGAEGVGRGGQGRIRCPGGTGRPEGEGAGARR